MKKLKIALIGAGGRGKNYTDATFSHPDKYQLVAVCEPVKEKRDYIKKLHNIPEENCFESWEEFLKLPKMADVVLICTQDQDQYAPAMEAIRKKYDLLLEKPITPSPKECMEIAQEAHKYGVKVVVCHVLRYTKFYKKMKECITSGVLGEVMNINHTEGVGNIHYSHSFARGPWRKKADAAPMILAKSCHDADLLQWLIGEPCTSLQSYGTLSHFLKENAPKDAPQYCMDGCPHKDECFYYAPELYKPGAWAWCLKHVVANKFEPTYEEVLRALEKGQYGRCVYKCDNDVVDHQVVNMKFGENKYVCFTMSAFNKGGRTTTIMGTKGELTANMEDSSIKIYDFATQKTITVMEPDDSFDDTINGGHGGGDEGIMIDLYEYIANNNPSESISDIFESCRNHLICFAAEESRVENTIIDMDKYESQIL